MFDARFVDEEEGGAPERDRERKRVRRTSLADFEREWEDFDIAAARR